MQEIRTVEYRATDGRVFGFKELCVAYETALKHRMEMLASVKFFDANRNELVFSKHLYGVGVVNPVYDDIRYLEETVGCEEVAEMLSIFDTATYIVFQNRDFYVDIMKIFYDLCAYAVGTYDFPSKLDKQNVLYFDTTDDVWLNYDGEVEKAREVMDNVAFFDRVKADFQNKGFDYAVC